MDESPYQVNGRQVWVNLDCSYLLATFETEKDARDYAAMLSVGCETIEQVQELIAERDQLREQMSLTREWLNAWEAGLFTADQCWVKLRGKLAEGENKS